MSDAFPTYAEIGERNIRDLCEVIDGYKKCIKHHEKYIGEFKKRIDKLQSTEKVT